MKSRKAIQMCVPTGGDITSACFLKHLPAKDPLQRSIPQALQSKPSCPQIPSVQHLSPVALQGDSAQAEFHQETKEGEIWEKYSKPQKGSLSPCQSPAKQQNPPRSQKPRLAMVHTGRGDYVVQAWILPAGGILNTQEIMSES